MCNNDTLKKHDIVHLIMAHTDIEHIVRLVKRLVQFSDVCLHFDSDSDDSALRTELKDYWGNGVYYLEPRIHCSWGGYNAIVCEIELLRLALNCGDYQRFVFLQGADYPIKTNREIVNFFNQHLTTEFIRGCAISDSKNKFLYDKSRWFLYINDSNIFTRLVNKLTINYDIKLRDGYIHFDKCKFTVFWGSAQWALTQKCARSIVDWYDSHPKFNRWFYYSLTCDETYFVTVVMNSKFASLTSHGNNEPEARALNEWRNLTYYDYSHIQGHQGCRIFTYKDLHELLAVEQLYARKVNSQISKELLDELDQRNIVSFS